MTHPTTVVPDSRPLSMSGAGVTHRGMVRERNEDAILTDPSGTLWAIADGLGGHGCGDVASEMVVEALSTIHDHGEPARALVQRLTEANEVLFRLSRRSGPMGATVVALIVGNATGTIAWAGDSRAYLWRASRMRLLTHDHSVVQELVASGAIPAEAARDHPQGHVVTRAIGVAATVEVDLTTVRLQAGDRLMLCSDGLTGCLDETWITGRIGEAAAPAAACRLLLDDALAAGAQDNVSIISVFVETA